MKNNVDIDSQTLEAKKLADQILFHKKKYYDGEPVISDAKYDALEEKLRKIDPQNPVLFIVGSPEGGKIIHDTPMLSCQKASNVNDIVKWSKGLDLYVGYKIDGFSLSLIYDDGKLIQAATRGNGTTGDDSTVVAMKISSIPKNLPETSRINIRGELYMPISEFKRINKLEDGKYSSPRNLAVGTIKHKDLNLLDQRVIDFKTFELLGFEDDSSLETKTRILESWGFNTADFELLNAPAKENIISLYERIEKQRSNFDFEIDGLVFKFNEAAERNRVGSTAHHPRWMMALKFASQGESSKIKGITWQVGRMGILTPVAELEPVEVMGALIKRATLHNAEFVEDLDAANGDTIMVIRSGDVIPKITEILIKGPNHVKFPIECPSCGSTLVRDGVNLLCTSDNCREKEIQRIRHWIKTLDIMGLGPKNIAKLYDSGLVIHFSDLYNSKLTENKLISMLGKNGAKVYRNIRSTREIPFHTFLAALGIESLGIQMAKVLTKHLKTYDDLKNASIDQLVNIEGISDITANYIVKGLNDPSLGAKVLEKGIKIIYGKKKPKIQPEKTTTLADFLKTDTQIDISGKKVRTQGTQKKKTVYVTGKIENRTKKEIQALLEENNYEWASVTKTLDLLVVGDNPGKAKLEKAKKFGIEIKKWKDFLQDLK
ncbi:MAG: NAD-dependent DNA ligase LigA [Candidatus Hermodarchaeota archaeon]